MGQEKLHRTKIIVGQALSHGTEIIVGQEILHVENIVAYDHITLGHNDNCRKWRQ